jgi:hypothetical protein
MKVKGRKEMRLKLLIAVPLVLLLAAGSSGAATTEARITPVRLGTIRISETTLEEAKAEFGEPAKIKPLGTGCWERMKRLYWGDDLRILFVYVDGRHVVLTPRVSARHVDLANGDRWRVATAEGLEVGDTEDRLRELYPRARNYGSRTYTLEVRNEYQYLSAILGQDDRVKALSASEQC